MDLKSKYDIIIDVRGIGLMLAVEFGEEGIVPKIIKQCLENGLVILSAGIYSIII